MSNETWVKRHYQIPGWGEGYLVMEGKRLIADCPEEDEADQIIRDHEAAHALGNLLAIMHRDGGHYAAEHGLLKATDDAIQKYYVRYDELERVKGALQTAREALEFYANWDNWERLVAEKALQAMKEQGQ